MIYPLYAWLASFAALLVVAIVVLILVKRKNAWFYVALVTGFVVLFWPVSQLAFSVLFYLNTDRGHSENPQEIPTFKAVIPDRCRKIEYYSDPTGRWFSCNISSEEFNNWIRMLELVPDESAACFPDTSVVNVTFGGKTTTLDMYSGKMAPNGANKVAFYRKETGKLLFCQWYW